MELALLVYLIGVLPSVSHLGGVSLFILSVFMFTLLGFCASENKNVFQMIKNHKKFTTLVVFTYLFSLGLFILIPSEKTMYIMAGAYATQQVYKSEQAKQIGDKLIKIIDSKMTEYITEIDKKPLTQVKQ